MFKRILSVLATVAILATAFWAFSRFQSADLALASPPGQSAAQAPSFDLSLSYPASPQRVGESFYIRARIHNVRGTGERGGIAFSFPQIEDGERGEISSLVIDSDGNTLYLGDYISSAADIGIVATGGIGASVYRKGDAIENPGFPDVTARHLLIENDVTGWDSSSDRIMEVQVTPKRAGDFGFGVLGWICADGYRNCEREPRPGSPRDEWQDQRGMSVRFGSVAIEPAPEEAPLNRFGMLIAVAVIAVATIAAIVLWGRRDDNGARPSRAAGLDDSSFTEINPDENTRRRKPNDSR